MLGTLKLIAMLLILISAPVQAVEPNESGDLEVIVALSKSLSYLQEWVSTPPEQGVPIPRLREIKPEELGYAAFIVSGISPNGNNEYNFSVSWRLIGPSGQVVFAYPKYARGKGKLHVRPAFYMADPALDILFEEKDPEGEYVLEAIAVDHVSGEKAVHSYRLRLVKTRSRALTRNSSRPTGWDVGFAAAPKYGR